MSQAFSTVTGSVRRRKHRAGRGDLGRCRHRPPKARLRTARCVSGGAAPAAVGAAAAAACRCCSSLARAVGELVQLQRGAAPRVGEDLARPTRTPACRRRPDPRCTTGWHSARDRAASLRPCLRPCCTAASTNAGQRSCSRSVSAGQVSCEDAADARGVALQRRAARAARTVPRSGAAWRLQRAAAISGRVSVASTPFSIASQVQASGAGMTID